jgi:hypothetical protein
VHEIVWDDRAFESLVLPPGYKDLILSFTKNQNSSEEILDDVIEGKGKAHCIDNVHSNRVDVVRRSRDRHAPHW